MLSGCSDKVISSICGRWRRRWRWKGWVDVRCSIQFTGDVSRRQRPAGRYRQQLLRPATFTERWHT